MNEETGMLYYDYVNRTVILQKVKEQVHLTLGTRSYNDYDNNDTKLMEKMMETHPGYDFSNCKFMDGVLQCGSSALKVSMLLLCSVLLVNFLFHFWNL